MHWRPPVCRRALREVDVIQTRPATNRNDSACLTHTRAAGRYTSGAETRSPGRPGQRDEMTSCAPRRSCAAAMRFAAALPLMFAAAACASGTINSASKPPAAENAASAQSTTAEDYIIGSGDSLSVFVYRNPDLSEAGVAVRPDGRTATPASLR